MIGALRGLISLLVAVGIAIGAAFLAVQVTHDRGVDAVAAREAYEEGRTPNSIGDRVRNALTGLDDDGVYVAPDGRSMLSLAGERAVAAAVRDSPIDVRVVVWRETAMAGGSSHDLVDQVVRALGESGERGLVLLWNGPESGEAELYGQNGYSNISPYEDFVGDPGKTLPRLIAELDESSVRWYDNDSDFDYWGGTGGGIAAGLLISSGILIGAALLYGVLMLITGRRLPGRWSW